MNTVTTIMRLTRNDLSRQKRRFSIAAGLFICAGVFAFLALCFGGAAASIWLASAYGLEVALLMVTAACLCISALAIIANAIFQRRQRRKLAQSAAVKGAAAATLLTLAKRRASLAPIVLAVAGFALASRLGSDTNDT